MLFLKNKIKRSSARGLVHQGFRTNLRIVSQREVQVIKMGELKFPESTTNIMKIGNNFFYELPINLHFPVFFYIFRYCTIQLLNIIQNAKHIKIMHECSHLLIALI